MNLQSLKNTSGARQPRKRVGRGRASGTGKTAGRGTKGQMSRTGSTHRAAFEGGQMPLYRRLPKRGFTPPMQKIIAGVNVASLSCFDAGTEVTPDMLRERGLANGRHHGIKILGNGDIDRKLTVKAHGFSASAKKKIEEAGGQCEVLS